MRPLATGRATEARSKVDEEALTGYRLRSIYTALTLTAVVLAAGVVYLVLPGHAGHVRISYFVGVLLIVAVRTVAGTFVPWSRLYEAGWGSRVLFAWGVADIALVCVAIAATGGGASELWAVTLLLIAFTAVSHPPAGLSALWVLTVVGYLVTVAATGWDLRPAVAFVRVSLMVLVFLVCSLLSRALASTMWSHGRAHEQASHRAELLSTVAATVRAMAAAEPARVIELALETLMELGFTVCAFCRYDARSETFSYTRARGVPLQVLIERQPASTGLLGVVRDRGRTSEMHYQSDGRARPEFVALGIHSAVATPIYREGELLAVLIGGTTRESTTEQDREVFELLAAEVSSALETEGLSIAIAHTETWFKSLVQNSSDMIIVLDDNMRAVYLSPSIERVLGYPVEELIGSELAHLIHVDDVDPVARAAEEHGTAEVDNLTVSCRLRHRDGGWRHVRATVRDLSRDPAVRGLVVNMHDVTEEMEAAEEVRARAAQAQAVAGLGHLALAGEELASLMEQAAVAVSAALGLGMVGVFEMRKGEGELALIAGTGWAEGSVGTARVVIDDRCREHLAMEPETTRIAGPASSPPELLVEHGVESSLSVAITVGSKVTGVLSVHSHASRPFTAGEVDCLRAVANVLAAATQRDAAATELESAALHDPLTRLPNRALLYDRLTHALAQLDRRSGYVAVLFIDLDNFKVVNDRYGHERGDSVLVAAVRRIRAATRPADTVARLGGDELVVACEGVSDETEARAIATHLLDALRSPFTVEGDAVSVTGSVGIALGQPGDDPHTLLRRADAAMYRAKKRGRDRVELYDEAMHLNASGPRDVERALRLALEMGHLYIAYQPEIELATGRVVVVEARIRWRHPVIGVLRPADFMPLAEETGLVNQIGAWILEESFRQMREWRASLPGGERLRLALDMPLRHLLRADIAEGLEGVLDRLELDPEALVLEISDGALAPDSQVAMRVMEGLRERGVGLVMRDFGPGASSLVQLRSLPIEAVKIGRSFVSRMDDEEADRAVVESLISMAHAIGKETIAEGVRSARQHEMLIDAGAEMGQGSYWCHPVKAAAVERWIREHPAGRDQGGPAGRVAGNLSG